MASFSSDTRPIIGRGPSLVARFLLLAALSIGLMVGDHRYHYMDRLRATLAASVYPLQWVVDAPFRLLHWARDSVADRDHLRAANAKLSAQLRDAQIDLQTLNVLREEVARLRGLNEAADNFTKQRLIAQIMQVDLDPLRHRVLINKGEQDGVFKGQPILDAQGVFGQITRVSPYTSEAIMISDPEHAIPVRVARSGLRTIAQGTGNLNRLSLPYLTGEADIKVGDTLIASGLGGVFPAGYPVGVVTHVSRDPAQTFAEVEAKPAAKLDSDYEVVLLWYQASSSDVVITQPKVPVTAPASVKDLDEAANNGAAAADAAAPTPGTPRASAPAPVANKPAGNKPTGGTP